MSACLMVDRGIATDFLEPTGSRIKGPEMAVNLEIGGKIPDHCRRKWGGDRDMSACLMVDRGIAADFLEPTGSRIKGPEMAVNLEFGGENQDRYREKWGGDRDLSAYFIGDRGIATDFLEPTGSRIKGPKISAKAGSGVKSRTRIVGKEEAIAI